MLSNVSIENSMLSNVSIVTQLAEQYFRIFTQFVDVFALKKKLLNIIFLEPT